MLSTEEITERYLSDARAAKQMFENGLMDRFELDEQIEKIDHKFFSDLEMLAIVTPTAELVRVLAYSHKDA